MSVADPLVAAAGSPAALASDRHELGAPRPVPSGRGAASLAKGVNVIFGLPDLSTPSFRALVRRRRKP